MAPIKPGHYLFQALLLVVISASIVIYGMLALSPSGPYTMGDSIAIRPPSTPPPSSFTNPGVGGSGSNSNSNGSLPIRVITHNIRYDASFFSRFPHEPPWTPTRHRLLTSQLQLLTRRHFTPPHTVVFLQEALHNQFRDVAEQSLGVDDWVALGVGRDDGKKKGEHEAVYYRKDAWKLVHWETRWLNEDGRVGRKGWDASSVRTVTCVVLDAVVPASTGGGGGSSSSSSNNKTKKKQPKRVLFLNAHLDDEGRVARRESAKLLLSILAELRRKWDPHYWVVGGDFNSPQSDDAYDTMVNKTGLIDVGTVAAAGSHRDAEQWGDFATYTGFDGNGERHPREVDRIDFLFVPEVGARLDADGVRADDETETGIETEDAEYSDGDNDAAEIDADQDAAFGAEIGADQDAGSYDHDDDDDEEDEEEEPTYSASVRRDGGIQGYAVIPNSFEGSKLGRVSDHRAVVVDLLV